MRVLDDLKSLSLLNIAVKVSLNNVTISNPFISVKILTIVTSSSIVVAFIFISTSVMKVVFSVIRVAEVRTLSAHSISF